CGSPATPRREGAPRSGGSRSADAPPPARSSVQPGATRTRAPAARSAGSSDVAPPRGRPDAPTRAGASPGSGRRRDGAPGSPVSPLQILQHRDVQRLLGDDLLQAAVLLLQRL